LSCACRSGGAIDRDARGAHASGHETHWDKLVLATGSYPFVPPVPGNDLPGCFVYRTLDDLDRLPPMPRARRGVVIGGGLLGLEAANALKQLGLETHVVEFAPNLMAVQLDNDGAAMLRKKIEALGVGVHTSKATTEIAARTAGWCCALPMANSWKPTWWSSRPGFVRRTRWRAAAGWLSANAAGSALTTSADLRSGRAGHRRMRPVGRKISVWWRRAIRWRAWPPPRWRERRKPSPARI
jgi:hypothetical protein